MLAASLLVIGCGKDADVGAKATTTIDDRRSVRIHMACSFP